MVSKEKLVKLAQDEINELDLAIKDTKTYLETLESLLHHAKTSASKAMSALESAKTIINNNREREKICPSLKRNEGWQSVVRAAEDNLKEKEQNRKDWEEKCKTYESKYQKQSCNLRKYEDDRRELIMRCAIYSASTEGEGLESVSAEEKEAFLSTRFSQLRP